MALKLKFNSTMLTLLIVTIVIIYGIVIEQTHKDNIPIHPNYELRMMEQSRAYRSNLQYSSPDVSPSAAYNEFTTSNFNQAYKDILPWGLRGDHKSQLVLGFLNQYGLGAKKNEKYAAYWYFSAINRNIYNERPLARGIEFMYGLDGHSVDYKNAAYWFNMAAQLSDDKY